MFFLPRQPAAVARALGLGSIQEVVCVFDDEGGDVCKKKTPINFVDLCKKKRTTHQQTHTRPGSCTFGLCRDVCIDVCVCVCVRVCVCVVVCVHVCVLFSFILHPPTHTHTNTHTHTETSTYILVV